MIYNLKKLPYEFAALEPIIDAKTMEIHHDKHHQAYVDNLNKALGSHPEFEMELGEMLEELDKVPEDIRMAVRNHGGGHLNHEMFWETMLPGSKVEVPEKFVNLKEEFVKAAMGRFGSGWAWISQKADGSLVVHSTANQDSPLMEGMKPILGIDVWEHAYYLKYQNRRADYVAAWWGLVNWEMVMSRFD